MNRPIFSNKSVIPTSGRILVVNIAGLSTRMLERPDDLPSLASLIRSGCMRPVIPTFPAVTCSAQATLTTGLPPSRHGIIANGIYDRTMCEARFWQQSERMIDGERFWKPWRAARKHLTVAMLFWQNTKYSNADIVVTPAPIHSEEGAMILSCYTKPWNLAGELESAFGPFPLHKYWGPMTGFESTAWIVKATDRVLRNRYPDITLVYLPHLDYVLQREGPDGPSVRDDLRKIDGAVGELRATAEAEGMHILIVSEYAIHPVTRSIDLNRELRNCGMIAVREIDGKEYLEIGDCRAFAMVDHQIAHIYTTDHLATEVAAHLLKKIDVECARTPEEKRRLGIDHPRSGDIVAIAPPGAWFSYYWWLDRAKAPPFAGTVDIHRKPGYDPLELFFNRAEKCIETNTALIKGSHGRPWAEGDDAPVMIASTPIDNLPERIDATQIPAVISSILGS